MDMEQFSDYTEDTVISYEDLSDLRQTSNSRIAFLQDQNVRLARAYDHAIVRLSKSEIVCQEEIRRRTTCEDSIRLERQYYHDLLQAYVRLLQESSRLGEIEKNLTRHCVQSNQLAEMQRRCIVHRDELIALYTSPTLRGTNQHVSLADHGQVYDTGAIQPGSTSMEDHTFVEDSSSSECGQPPASLPIRNVNDLSGNKPAQSRVNRPSQLLSAIPISGPQNFDDTRNMKPNFIQFPTSSERSTLSASVTTELVNQDSPYTGRFF